MQTQSVRDAIISLTEAQLGQLSSTAAVGTYHTKPYESPTEIYNRQFERRFKGIPEETLLKLAQEHFPEYFI